MKRQVALMSTLAVLLIWGCRNKREATQEVNAEPWVTALDSSAILISYKRTPCFGTCPHFDFVLYGSGRAIYTGKNFVERKGQFSGRLADVAKAYLPVYERATSIGYFSMENVYDEPMVTDLPSVTTLLRSPGGTHAVTNRYKGPESLDSLYIALDALMESISWQPAHN